MIKLLLELGEVLADVSVAVLVLLIALAVVLVLLLFLALAMGHQAIVLWDASRLGDIKAAVGAAWMLLWCLLNTWLWVSGRRLTGNLLMLIAIAFLFDWSKQPWWSNTLSGIAVGWALRVLLSPGVARGPGFVLRSLRGGNWFVVYARHELSNDWMFPGEWDIWAERWKKAIR